MHVVPAQNPGSRFHGAADAVRRLVRLCVRDPGLPPSRLGCLLPPWRPLFPFRIWPQTWKMIWAPLVDTLLNARQWYVIGALSTGLTILALGFVFFRHAERHASAGPAGRNIQPGLDHGQHVQRAFHGSWH